MSLWPELHHVSVLSQWRSVQFSRSVVSDSLQPRGLQHAGPPWQPRELELLSLTQPRINEDPPHRGAGEKSIFLQKHEQN